MAIQALSWYWGALGVPWPVSHRTISNPFLTNALHPPEFFILLGVSDNIFGFCWGFFVCVFRNEEIKLLWVSWTCLPLMRGAYWKHTFLDGPNSPGLPLLGAEQALLENRCNSQALWGVSLHSSVLCSWALSKMEQGQGPQSIPSLRDRHPAMPRGAPTKSLICSSVCQGPGTGHLHSSQRKDFKDTI